MKVCKHMLTYPEYKLNVGNTPVTNVKQRNLVRTNEISEVINSRARIQN